MNDLVLVTGASGFVGRHLVVSLAAAGWRVLAAARDPGAVPARKGVTAVAIPDLRHGVDWRPIVDGVKYVVHLAGIAHSAAPIRDAEYMTVNADATAALARAAAAAGVKRMVLMSSVRAQTGPTAASILTETDEPRPTDAYGLSKLTAEQYLANVLAPSTTEWSVLRPVLVYGPGVKGNMRTLFHLARSRWPLPLADLPGLRSLLALDNLADAVGHVLINTRASHRVFLVADDEPVTVAQIVGALRAGLNREANLISVPAGVMRFGMMAAGRGSAWQRLAGDLVVETSALRSTGWDSPVGTLEGLADAIASEAPAGHAATRG